MKEKLEIIVKTAESIMENQALLVDQLNEIKDGLDNMEIMPKGYWEDINENTPEKRCSNCGCAYVPTLHCANCGSKNTYRQNPSAMVQSK